MLGNIHPMIVHFPIALLAVVPIFLALSLVFKTQRKAFLTSALILLVIGTAVLFLSVESGESAAEMISKSALTSDAMGDLREHAEHADQCRLLYGFLVIIFIAFLWAEKKLPAALVKITPVVLLIISCGSTAVLLNTAHYGGELVHEHHIHSQLFDKEQPAP